MKKMIAVLTLLLAVTAMSWAQVGVPGRASFAKKVEFSLYGGFSLTSAKGTSTYYDNWSETFLVDVNETTNIDFASKTAPFFGGGVSFFFIPNFGIGLNAGYMRSKIDTTALFTYQWRWNDGRSFTYYAPEDERTPSSWDGLDNYFSSVPISLNFIGRFGGRFFQGNIQAGPTLYLNHAYLDSFIGYGVTLVDWPWQWIDALKVPVWIDQSWTAIGANFGAGFTVWVTPMLGLSLDVRYFFCPKKNLDWSMEAGEYDGIFFNTIKNWDWDEADYIYENGLFDIAALNPSFFQVLFGIKIGI